MGTFNVFLRKVDTAYTISGTHQPTLRSSPAPSNSADLANKAYVDATLTAAAASGLFWQVPVTEIASAEPSTNAVSGSAFAVGDRVLVGSSVSDAADEFYGHENKFAVKTSSGWDFTAPQEGAAVWVEAGSTNANSNVVYNGSAWVLMSSISGAVPLTKIAANGDNLGSVVKLLQTSTGDDAPEAGDILSLDSSNQIAEATAIPSSLLSDATESAKGIVQITAADFDLPSSGVRDIKDGVSDGDIIRNDGTDLSAGQILSVDGTASRIDAGTAAEIKSAAGLANTSTAGVMSFNGDHFSVTAGGEASLVKGGASAQEFLESKSSSFSGGEILKFVNSGGVEGIQPATSAEVAGAMRDASSSDQGVFQLDSDDFLASSGAISDQRCLDTDGISALSADLTVASVSALREAYIFDMSGASSELTLTLPSLLGASDIVGKQIQIAIAGLGTGASLKIDAGSFTNDSSTSVDQHMDEFHEIVLDQDHQAMKLLCVQTPLGSDSAAKTCWKVA